MCIRDRHRWTIIERKEDMNRATFDEVVTEMSCLVELITHHVGVKCPAWLNRVLTMLVSLREKSTSLHTELTELTFTYLVFHDLQHELAWCECTFMIVSMSFLVCMHEHEHGHRHERTRCGAWACMYLKFLSVMTARRPWRRSFFKLAWWWFCN